MEVIQTNRKEDNMKKKLVLFLLIIFLTSCGSLNKNGEKTVENNQNTEENNIKNLFDNVKWHHTLNFINSDTGNPNFLININLEFNKAKSAEDYFIKIFIFENEDKEKNIPKFEDKDKKSDKIIFEEKSKKFDINITKGDGYLNKIEENLLLNNIKNLEHICIGFSIYDKQGNEIKTKSYPISKSIDADSNEFIFDIKNEKFIESLLPLIGDSELTMIKENANSIDLIKFYKIDELYEHKRYNQLAIKEGSLVQFDATTNSFRLLNEIGGVKEETNDFIDNIDERKLKEIIENLKKEGFKKLEI